MDKSVRETKLANDKGSGLVTGEARTDTIFRVVMPLCHYPYRLHALTASGSRNWRDPEGPSPLISATPIYAVGCHGDMMQSRDVPRITDIITYVGSRTIHSA
ncbi:hypothetical protein ACJJTC_011351 [Scirpophaga incertulas]